MDNVDILLKNTLQQTCKNVSRLFYTGKAKTFLTYQIVVGVDTDFSDDESSTVEYTYMIHIFSKSDYIELLERVKQALKTAGFYSVTIEAELYETDTGFYHVPLMAKYKEVAKYENRT